VEVAFGNDTFSDTLMKLSDALKSSDPALSLEIRDLAVNGWVLSGRQYQAANGGSSSQFDPSSKGDRINPDLNRELTCSAQILALKNNSCNNDYTSQSGVAEAAVISLSQFKQQFNKVNNVLKDTALSSHDQELVQWLGQSIINKSNANTTANALLTEQTTDVIVTCANGKC
jgi:hypothetical protein